MIKPFPKPSLFQPRPKRLPPRYAVTVVAGFKFNKGIVLCADTQETVGIAKRHVPKLRFEEFSGALKVLSGGSDLAVAFCGATNNGPFVDKLVDSAWIAAQVENNIDDLQRHRKEHPRYLQSFRENLSTWIHARRRIDLRRENECEQQVIQCLWTCRQ